jgi:hypothetical protein
MIMPVYPRNSSLEVIGKMDYDDDFDDDDFEDDDQDDDF